MFRRGLQVRAVIFHWTFCPVSAKEKAIHGSRSVYGTPEMRSIFFTSRHKRIRRYVTRFETWQSTVDSSHVSKDIYILFYSFYVHAIYFTLYTVYLFLQKHMLLFNKFNILLVSNLNISHEL